ncbi:positive regulation of endothelial cell chemotaxis [Blomia tropicalis]|nr:positive regulation of endothelial cell chemotaxis [Blomia tropicalis]
MATYHQTTKTTTATTTTSTFGQHHQHILLVIFLIILSSFVQCLLTTNDINNLIISDKSNFDFSKTIIAYHNGRLNRSSSDRPFLLHTQFRPYIINVTLSAVTFDTELLSHHIDLSFVNRSKIYLGGIGQLHQVGVYGDGQTNDGRTLRIDISRPFISNITLDEDDDCFPRIPTSHREGAFSRWHKEKLIKTIFQVKDVLFTCGIDNCGLCTIIKLGANGFERTREFNDTSEPVSFLASRRSSYVFKGHYHNAETFYVGFEPDDRAINSTPPFLSARTFSHSYFTYTLDMNNFRSKVEFSRKENLKQSYPIQFLYGFEYGRFAYMVTIQPAKLYSSLMETRLIRICTEDDSFRSYSEIPLVCRSPAMNDHQIAVAATITHQINDDDDDDVDDNDKKKKKSTLLYVTFENGQWSNRMNGTLNSAICSYTMEDIETAFRNSIVNCYHLGDRAGLVSSIYGEERNCVAIEGNLDPYELECAGTGTISHNRYILGKVPIAGRYEFTIFNDLVTSIGAVRLNLIEQRATRLVVATNNSRLITLDLSDDDDTIDVKQYYELNRTAIGPFRSNPLFESSNGGYLYFRSQNGLIQIGIQSCATYTTCTACFMFGSHCWWWNDRCIRSKHVPEEHRLAGPICSPIVYNFTPQIGPIQGGTIIMIYGDNFGGSSLPSQTLDDYVNVTIGRRQCIVQKRTKKMIECQLDKQIDEMDNMIDSGMMVSVHVSYHKDAALLHYNINGTDTSKQHFTFVTASVKGIHPWYGPRIGGTTVALFGENFHIGTNVKVEFISNRGRFPCRMRNRSRRFVICVTSNNTYNDDDDNEDIDLQINLSIDYFTYELNNNQSFNVDSSYIFNTEYDEKRRRRMISSRINPYSRIGSSLFVNMLLRQSKLEFMESFEYRPNPRIISVHDFRSNGSIVYDSFHTIETGGTELIFEGMNLDSIWYPLIDVIFFDSNGWNHSIVSNCTVIQSTMIVCLLPKLSGRAINSYKPVNARFILHMDGFKWNGVPSEPPALIIYHRKPEFRSFDSLVHVEIDEPTIQLEGNYLFDELPYNITVNDTIQCIRDRLASSEKSILCRFELTDEVHSILEYDVPYRIRVQIGYNVQFEFGEMAFSNNQAISSFGFISIMFVLVLLIVLVVAFIIRNQLQRAKINARDKGPYALVDMPTKTLGSYNSYIEVHFNQSI